MRSSAVKFLIVVPSIRQSLPTFDTVIGQIKNSLTLPTELVIVDGTGGKVAALNRAYDELLTASDADVYVTLDDDLIPPRGWQEALAKAFVLLPDFGLLSLWLGDDAQSLAYMDAAQVGPEERVNGLRYRVVQGNHHIPGCLLAFRRGIALEIGKLPESELEYQIWEDAWRGRRVRKLGWKLGYVVMDDFPELHPYDDTSEYRAVKERDLKAGRQQVQRYLQLGGVGDSVVTRLRRWIAKVRGRAN